MFTEFFMNNYLFFTNFSEPFRNSNDHKINIEKNIFIFWVSITLPNYKIQNNYNIIKLKQFFASL